MRAGVPRYFSSRRARCSGVGRPMAIRASLTSSGMSIYRSSEYSCLIRLFGNSGSQSFWSYRLTRRRMQRGREFLRQVREDVIPPPGHFIDIKSDFRNIFNHQITISNYVLIDTKMYMYVRINKALHSEKKNSDKMGAAIAAGNGFTATLLSYTYSGTSPCKAGSHP